MSEQDPEQYVDDLVEEPKPWEYTSEPTQPQAEQDFDDDEVEDDE